jgi:hypothetical protein
MGPILVRFIVGLTSFSAHAMARHWRMLRGIAKSGRHDTRERLFLSISGYLADQTEKCENHASYSIFSWFSVSGLIAHQVSVDRCSATELGAGWPKLFGFVVNQIWPSSPSYRAPSPAFPLVSAPSAMRRPFQ